LTAPGAQTPRVALGHSGYDRRMNPETPPPPENDVFDDWRWHVEGAFPAGRPPERAYVHIGVFVAWLARRGMTSVELLGPDARATIESLAHGNGSPMDALEPTSGRLTEAMLAPEGRAFAGAYYAPEYGYARDWRRAFGRPADAYEVAGTWATYNRMEPILDRRHAEWTAAGRPDLRR
jgi:hypothetical protein